MIDSVEATGPRKSAGDARPAYEFIVHSQRQPGDGDEPDLVLRRRLVEKTNAPAREEVTVIVREISAPAAATDAAKSTAAPELPPVKPAGDRVAEYIASISDHVTDDVARVIDRLMADEERADAPAEYTPPFTSDGSPFADSPHPPDLSVPSTDPSPTLSPTLAPTLSPNRYTKRVEFDRS